MNTPTHEVFMKNVSKNGLLKVLSLAALFVSCSAFAGTKDSGSMEYLPKGTAKCSRPDVADATLSILVTGLDTKGSPVLYVNIPRGETEVGHFKLKCPQQKGAIEFAIRCNLATPEGTYDIWVGSPGDASLNASVTPVDAAGNQGAPVWLACRLGFHNPLGQN